MTCHDSRIDISPNSPNPTRAWHSLLSTTNQTDTTTAGQQLSHVLVQRNRHDTDNYLPTMALIPRLLTTIGLILLAHA